ncbi:MAG: hypothetical protein PHP14_01515 [Candidatus Pacebacteria bacterium]|nr:hypothetical protein [Candidatus Paceibacterota bacterium]MDD3808089.1 hypothetical protein [Candidatus Paceibacterota bacterium]
MVVNKSICKFFENTVNEIRNTVDEKLFLKATKLIYNYLVTDVIGMLISKNIKFDDLKMSVNNFSKLIGLIINDKVSSRAAKIILEKIIIDDSDPEIVMKDNGLEQVSNDEEIRKFVLDVLGENPKSVDEYKSGKIAVLQFLIGKTMGKAKGAGNPGKIKEILEMELNKQ